MQLIIANNFKELQLQYISQLIAFWTTILVDLRWTCLAWGVHALQAKRLNIDELEPALEAKVLRRNNTAIMDIVSSWDTIVSELNGRVGVFE